MCLHEVCNLFSSATTVPFPTSVNKSFASPSCGSIATSSFFLNPPKHQREQAAPQVRNNSIILILHIFRTSSTIFRSPLTDSHFYLSRLWEKSNSSSHHHRLSTGGVFLSANPTKTNLVWYVQITSFLMISTNYSDVCRTLQFCTVCAVVHLCHWTQLTNS